MPSSSQPIQQVGGQPCAVILVSADGSQNNWINNILDPVQHRPGYFQWSPDSKTLAYFDHKENSIALMSVETLAVSQLTKVEVDEKSQWPYYYGNLIWLPDGKQIVFIQGDGSGGFVASVVDLSGNVKTLFTAKYPVGLYAESVTN